MNKLEGIITALVTPFKENGLINYQVLEILIEKQIAEGVSGLLVGGTTGEGALIRDEIYDLISFTVKKVDGRVLVIASLGELDKADLINRVQKINQLGVDYLLVLTPYYMQTNEFGLYQYFKTVATYSNVPIIIYNVPSRTGQKMPLYTIKKCFQIDNIVGIKEASSDISYFMKVLKIKNEKKVFIGNDNLYLPERLMGADGIISVFSNIHCKALREMEDKIRNRKIVDANNQFLKYLPLMEILFVEPNPIPIKYIMNYLGYQVGDVHFPLAPPSLLNQQLIKNSLNEVMKLD